MNVKCLQLVLPVFVLLLAGVVTPAIVQNVPQSVSFLTPTTLNPVHEDVVSKACGVPSESERIVQTATAYGQGRKSLCLDLDKAPESVPKPIPLFLLMFWIEWAYKA